MEVSLWLCQEARRTGLRGCSQGFALAGGWALRLGGGLWAELVEGRSAGEGWERGGSSGAEVPTSTMGRAGRGPGGASLGRP